MVQFNYDFTQTRDSMHGNTEIFSCQMPKFTMELIIYARQEVLFTRDKMCHRYETS